jgi:transcriptional regulator with XRE-family HTH domain
MAMQVAAGARRSELSDFLRTRRARLMPSDVGLLEGPRRRTPGLRREEVALLANIGATWYTRLEQGQQINVSSEVLRSIGHALRLSRSEMRHLFTLAGQTLDEAEGAHDEIVSDLMRRTLHRLDPNPAYIRGRHYDILAFNDAWRAALCYRPSDETERRNLLRSFFMEPEARVRHAQWDVIGPKIVAQFRSVAARYPDDPVFRTLIDELLASSEHFRDWWARHDVNDVSEGMKHFFHPEVGDLFLDHVSLAVPDYPDMRLIIYTAEPGSENERKLRLLTSRSAGAAYSAAGGDAAALRTALS